MEEGKLPFSIDDALQGKNIRLDNDKTQKLFLLKKLMLQNKNKMNNKKNKMISLNKNICEGRGKKVVVFVNVLGLSNINWKYSKIAA